MAWEKELWQRERESQVVAMEKEREREREEPAYCWGRLALEVYWHPNRWDKGIGDACASGTLHSKQGSSHLEIWDWVHASSSRFYRWMGIWSCFRLRTRPRTWVGFISDFRRGLEFFGGEPILLLVQLPMMAALDALLMTPLKKMIPLRF